MELTTSYKVFMKYREMPGECRQKFKKLCLDVILCILLAVLVLAVGA